MLLIQLQSEMPLLVLKLLSGPVTPKGVQRVHFGGSTEYIHL